MKTVNVHGGNVHKASRNMGTSLEHILDFSANINPLGMSPAGTESMKKHFEEIIHYPDPELHSLTNTLCRIWNMPESYIALGNGAAELIYGICRLSNVDTVYVPAPGFSEYAYAANSCGLQVKEYSLTYDAQQHTFMYNLDLLIDTMKECTRSIVFIGNPNNPCGTLWTHRNEELFHICKENHNYIVFDESFIDFLGDSFSMRQYVKKYENCMVVHSLTKFYAVPGLRVGAMMGHPTVIEQVKASIPTWSVNHFAQVYGEAAVLDRAYIESTREFLGREKEWLYTQLSALNVFELVKPSVNYILGRLNSKYSFGDLQDYLYSQSILVRDCSNYSTLGPNWFRIAVKDHARNVTLLTVLKEYFQNYRR